VKLAITTDRHRRWSRPRATSVYLETQNVTVALPRALLRKLKVLAAKRETSISALLAASLEEIVRHEDEYESAMRRALGRARKGYDLGTGGDLPVQRGELHER
jgi:predicted transcriptional regulator